MGTAEDSPHGDVDHLKRLRVAYESFTKSHPSSPSLSSGPMRLPSLLAFQDIIPHDRPTIPMRQDLGDHRLSAEDVIQEVLLGIFHSSDGPPPDPTAAVKNQSSTMPSKMMRQDASKMIPSVAENADFSIDELYAVFSTLDSPKGGEEEEVVERPQPVTHKVPLSFVQDGVTGGPTLQVALPPFQSYNQGTAALPTSTLQPRGSFSNHLVGSRNLRHPLSPASRDSVLACSNLTMSHSSSIPTVVALTSFPFRITSVNPAFCHMTRRCSSPLIGMSFFDLFVKETNFIPCMTTCPTLEGMFTNDIVRVKSFRHPRSARPPMTLDPPSSPQESLESSSWRLRALDLFVDNNDDSMHGNGNEQEDETGIFCHIEVHEFPRRDTEPASLSRPAPKYFSIQLSPLRGVSESLHSPRTGGDTATSGIVYLPMPAMPRQG